MFDFRTDKSDSAIGAEHFNFPVHGTGPNSSYDCIEEYLNKRKANGDGKNFISKCAWRFRYELAQRGGQNVLKV